MSAAGLNPNQQRAVEWSGGSAAVNAGAGTGKTRTLVSRFLRLTSQPDQPVAVDRILAITYTKAAAAEMRQRIAASLRQAGRFEEARRMSASWIMTIHAFCRRVLFLYALEAELDPAFRLADDCEELKRQAWRSLREQCADDGQLKAAYLDLRRFISDSTLLSAIRMAAEYAANQGIDPLSHPEALAPSDDSATVAFTLLFTVYLGHYQRLKQERSLLDFSDILLVTDALLRHHPLVATELSARFDAIMIDEFQDTNAFQYRLLQQLSAGRLFAVGDEQQSIFGFQGAQVEVFRDHRAAATAADPAANITLNVNYRSHPEILRFVNELFCHPKLLADASLPLGSVDTLPADLPVPTPAHVRALELTLTGPRLSFQDALQQAEARWIADRFEEILADPMAARSADDLVVLVFQHSHARPIADELSRRGLAVQILGDTNFLNLPPIRLARDLLRVVRNPADPEPFLRLLLSPFGRLSDRGIYELAASRGDYGNREERARPLWQAAHEAQLSDSGDACELAAVVATIEAARSRIGVMALSEVLTRAFAERGVDDYYLSRGQAGRQAWANFRKLCRLSDVFQTEGHDSLDFAAHLDRMEEANAKIEAESLSPRDQSRIRIMTVHRAKGLEFPVVAVALASCYRVNHLYNAQFLSGTDAQGRLDWEWKLNDDDVETCSKGYEQRKADALARDDAEDIRKLYVACTRACHTLLLSYGTGTSATARTDGRCGLGPLVAEAVHSLPEPWRPVIEEQAFCAADFEGPVHPDDQPLPTNLMPPRPAVTPSLASVAAVDFDIRQISASDITAHVRCPLRFYHFNLLRAGQLRSPDPQAAANRGSLIHLLLETVGRSKGNLDRSRIEAICAQHDVDPEDKAGMDALTSVLRNYLASQTADDLAACSRVEYEYPFYLKLNDDNGSDGGDDNSDGDNGSDNNSSDNSDNSDDDNNSNGNDGRGRAKNPHSHKSNAANYLYLHGFIDALGYRTDGTALVVDYKTGGQADEEQAKKEQEYEPQAAVYALVALTLGAHRVEVRMLRPEVPDAKDPTQAQTFSWTWDAAERHNLEARMLNYARAMRRTGRGGRAHTLGPPEPAPDERTCQFCAIAPQLCGRKRRIMDS